MASIRMVRLGTQGMFLDECLDGSFIGVDFGFEEDLTDQLPDEWKQFNKAWIPRWLELHPGKSRVAAGLSCGMTWTVAHGLPDGTYVLSPDSNGVFHAGRISGPYQYEPPRRVRRLRSLGRMGSCLELLRGGTRPSCVSGRSGWWGRFVPITSLSGRR